MAKKSEDHSLLEMALVGYEAAKESIEQKISEIRRKIGAGGRAVAAAVERVTSDKPKRRKMSAAGRKRIALAQKKRWAEARKADAVAIRKPRAKAKAAASSV